MRSPSSGGASTPRSRPTSIASPPICSGPSNSSPISSPSSSSPAGVSWRPVNPTTVHRSSCAAPPARRVPSSVSGTRDEHRRRHRGRPLRRRGSRVRSRAVAGARDPSRRGGGGTAHPGRPVVGEWERTRAARGRGRVAALYPSRSPSLPGALRRLTHGRPSVARRAGDAGRCGIPPAGVARPGGGDPGSRLGTGTAHAGTARPGGRDRDGSRLRSGAALRDDRSLPGEDGPRRPGRPPPARRSRAARLGRRDPRAALPTGGTIERLQKLIAHSGIASRRSAEDLVRTGRVTVDGVPAHLGQKIEPGTARVEVDGIPLPVKPGLVHYLVYKPVGVVSTADDPQGRSTVLGLVPGDTRVYPVGRLDTDSEGLLIVTNDGDLTAVVTHPRYGITKTYLARVTGHPGKTVLSRLLGGIDLDDGPARALTARGG